MKLCVIKGGNITHYTRCGSKTTRAVIPAESDAHLTILNIKNSRKEHASVVKCNDNTIFFCLLHFFWGQILFQQDCFI